MALPTLPPAPSRTDPANFAAAGDAWVAALPAWTDAVNQQEALWQVSAINATSTTSWYPSLSTKTFTIQSGKSFAVGAPVTIIDPITLGNTAFGTVVSYSGTSLTINVTVVNASPTSASNWVISICAPRNGTETFTRVNLDPNFTLTQNSNNSIIGFDVQDYIGYNRTSNSLDVYISNSSYLTINATDGPQRTSDATTANGLTRKSQVDSSILNALPVGSCIYWPAETAPTGWMEHDGTSLLRSGAYAPLFAVIGTTFGAVDSTHFNLPYGRGRFIRNWANGSSDDPDRASRIMHAPGATGVGDKVGSVQGWQIQSHSHGVAPRDQETSVGGLAAGGGSSYTTVQTDVYGGNQTNPINYNLMPIIKVVA